MWVKTVGLTTQEVRILQMMNFPILGTYQGDSKVYVTYAPSTVTLFWDRLSTNLRTKLAS